MKINIFLLVIQVDRIFFKDKTLCRDRIEKEEELLRLKLELDDLLLQSKENLRKITETDMIFRKKELLASNTTNKCYH